MKKTMKITASLLSFIMFFAIMMTFQSVSISAHSLYEWANYYSTNRAISNYNTDAFAIANWYHMNSSTVYYFWDTTSLNQMTSTERNDFKTALTSNDKGGFAMWSGFIGGVETTASNAHMKIWYNSDPAITGWAAAPIKSGDSSGHYRQNYSLYGDAEIYLTAKGKQQSLAYQKIMMGHELGHHYGINDLDDYGVPECESIYWDKGSAYSKILNQYGGLPTRHDKNAMYICLGKPFYIDANNNKKYLKSPGVFANNEWVTTPVGGENYFVQSNGIVADRAYKVKYNANGGSGTIADSTHIYGTAKNLTANSFTRTGYTFKGWATSPAGAVVYTNQQSVLNLSSVNGTTVNLYAVWEGNPYKVKYNANGGFGATSDSNHVYGTASSLSANGFSRAGYTFKGWATSPTGAVVYTNNQSVSNLSPTNGAIVNLYAVWQNNTYTISFNANGGTGAPASQIKTYLTPLELSISRPVRNGYTFLGWADSPDATVGKYSPGDYYTDERARTLYAVWEQWGTVTTMSKNTTYPVSISSGGNFKVFSFTPEKSGVYSISSLNSSESTYVQVYDDCGNFLTARLGYNNFNSKYYLNAMQTYYFKSQFNNSTSTGTFYVQITADTATTYTITYNANASGVAYVPSRDTKIAYQSVMISRTVPTRPGYVFIGWGTSPTATSSLYKPCEQRSNDGDITLYAIWRMKGDVNLDGKANSSDASIVLRIAADNLSGNPINYTAEQLAAADVNNDGLVNSSDAALIINYTSSVLLNNSILPEDFFV